MFFNFFVDFHCQPYSTVAASDSCLSFCHWVTFQVCPVCQLPFLNDHLIMQHQVWRLHAAVEFRPVQSRSWWWLNKAATNVDCSLQFARSCCVDDAETTTKMPARRVESKMMVCVRCAATDFIHADLNVITLLCQPASGFLYTGCLHHQAV